MKASAFLVAALLTTGAFVAAPAQSSADDRPVMVIGDIVRYEPGHVIVVRDSSNNEVTYNLTPSLTIPTGIEVGRRVTLYTMRGDDGSSTVTKITTSVTPEGNVARTVERTHTNAAGETSTSTSTNIVGTVQAYEPGHSLTLVRPDGSHVTYMVNAQTHIPEGLAVGRTIMLTPAAIGDTGDRIADTITYTETKTETKHGKTETHTKTKTKKVSENN
jgi:hypothetical protein